MVAIAIIVLGQLAVGRLDWVAQYPSAWVLPLKDWIDSFFEWLVYGVHFFSGTSLEFTPRDLTRGFSAVLAYPLGFTESLFRSEEHTSELQSLMRNSYAVFCLTTIIKIG